MHEKDTGIAPCGFRVMEAPAKSALHEGANIPYPRSGEPEGANSAAFTRKSLAHTQRWSKLRGCMRNSGKYK
jgi:hypothetical protein